MNKLHKLDTIAAFLLAALMAIPFLFGSGGGLYAAAASDVVSQYESSNVLDDLQGMTIDGEKFDITEYYFDKGKNLQLLSFVEFGYSFIGNQEDYGLYVYVYNPRGLDLTANPGQNQISLKCGDAESYKPYHLDYLNRSTKEGYEGLFYKFKIALTAAQRAEILQSLDKSARVYDVSEIELSSVGNWNATAYKVANVYTYTGYAKGYGAVSDEKSTLKCSSKDSVTLSLDVHGAAYRPKGTNGKNSYTQDMLHSVYFSIPNSYINEYGDMTAVHAKWLNALTAPIFVTGNSTVYNDLKKHIGQEVNPETYSDMSFYYTFRSNLADYSFSVGSTTVKGYQYGYNYPSKLSTTKIYNSIKQLCYIFPAPNGIADINEADHYTLKGSEVLEYIRNYQPGSGGDASDLVAGKYYRELFASVNAEPTEVNIYADETYSLTSETVSQSWWEKLFGTTGTNIESSEEFKDIKAIQEVKQSDFTGTQAEQCKKLYLDESYYKDFKDYYTKATREDKTVYLFRYYQSEYICSEAYEGEWEEHWSPTGGGVGGVIAPGYVYSLKNTDTNAYVAQEVVSLDFDIIDVTLTKDDVSTVIGVVSSPIDIIPDIIPPVNTTPDEVPLWQKIVAVVGLVCIAFVGIKFLQWLFGSKKK